MDVLQAMEKRHSVRSFTNQPIDGKIKIIYWILSNNAETKADSI